MMSMPTRTLCCSCNTQSGSTACEGCSRKYCYRCLTNHRDELLNELETLANSRNVIKETFDRTRTNNSPVTQQIDLWAKEMHTKIDQVVQKAKEEFQRALSRTNDDIRQTLDKISEDIRHRQKTREALDTDVDRIRRDLENLERNVHQMHHFVRVDTSNSQTINWNSLISIIASTSNGNASGIDPPRNPSGKMSLARFEDPPRDKFAPPVYDYGPRNQPPVHAAVPLPVKPPPWAPNGYPQRFAEKVSEAQSAQGSHDRRSAPPKNILRQYTCICCKTPNKYKENTKNICAVCKTPYDF